MRLTACHSRNFLIGAALWWLSGCTTAISPPHDVAAPARVGLLDHGLHASLVLELPDKSIVRYGYGDWDWYALGQTGVVQGSRAILWPSKAALGRRHLPGPFSPTAVSEQVRIVIEDAIYIEVEADRVRQLVERLDAIFDENIATRVHNPASDLELVKHPDAYWLLHNSNQMVGRWLESLGSEVRGFAILSIWRLDTEQPPD